MEEVTSFIGKEHEVTRFHLEMSMGVGHINLYVIENLSNNKKLLVDTGPKDRDMQARFFALLDQEGSPLESIDAVLLTG